MSGFEYKVVPAPTRGLKAKGVKGTQARFANALQTVMNQLGAEGWEYQRTDTLPVEERQGLTGKTTSFQNMLVFRRALTTAPEVVEVAALIEDQTEALGTDAVNEAVQDTPATEPDTAEDVAAHAPEPDAPLVEDMPEAPSDEPTRTLAAEERVTETLTAPFTFPWNRRGDGTAKPDSDNDSRPAAD